MRKRQALKFTHWSHFPCGPGVPHSARHAGGARRSGPSSRDPAGATLGSAAQSGCLDAARGHRQQISYYNNSTPSTRSTLPGRLAARSIGCLYNTQLQEVWTARRHGGHHGHAAPGDDEPHDVTTHGAARLPDHRRDADGARTSIGLLTTLQSTSTPPQRPTKDHALGRGDTDRWDQALPVLTAIEIAAPGAIDWKRETGKWSTPVKAGRPHRRGQSHEARGAHPAAHRRPEQEMTPKPRHASGTRNCTAIWMRFASAARTGKRNSSSKSGARQGFERCLEHFDTILEKLPQRRGHLMKMIERFRRVDPGPRNEASKLEDDVTEW